MTAKAFLIALILTPILRDIFRVYNIVDRPAQRKVHAYPIPRVGGIPIAVAYLAALVWADTDAAWTQYAPAALQLMPGAALVLVIGLADDFFNLKPTQKMAGLIVAASLVFYSGVHMDTVAGYTLPYWLSYPVTVFWLLLTSNALNLIDGLDGLCAGMGLFATLTLFAASLLHNNLPLSYATLPLAGALLGFLCYNFNPATVFLGDSGALLIGFLLGCYGLVWTQKTETLLSVLVPLLALSIPLLDVSLSVVRRYLRNQPIFSADRGHIHHRLLDRGLSTRQAVWVLYLVATLGAGFALLLTSSPNARYQSLVGTAFLIAVVIGIRQLRYTEFDVAGRLLFRGEFHRAVDVRLQLNQLETILQKATSEEAWWLALVDGAQRLGFVSIEFIQPSLHRHETLRPGESGDWSFEVAAPDGGIVRLRGSFALNGSAFDVVKMGSIVQGTHFARRPEPSRQAAGRTAAVPQ